VRINGIRRHDHHKSKHWPQSGRGKELVRVIDPLPELMSQIYLLVHLDLRDTPRGDRHGSTMHDF
jgi:hypothetical protein